MFLSGLTWNPRIILGQTLKFRADNPDTPATSGIVLELMLEKGFDLSRNSLKQVTPEMVSAADRIIVMLGSIPPEGFLGRSEKVEVWDVVDPIDTSRETTATIIDEVIGRVRELVREMG